jgi:hypothetical protein
LTNLSNILISYSADLLEVCSALGDTLKIVSVELKLILDVLGSLDINTGVHSDPAGNFLAQEVSAI